MRKLIRYGLGMLAALSMAGTAAAATVVGTMNVLLTVQDTCVVVANDVNFGTILVDAVLPVSAPGTLLVNCSTGTNFTIGLDDGQYFNAGTRRLWDGTANFIAYSIWKPGAPGSEWGDGVILGTTHPGVGINAPLPFNFFAEITQAGPYVKGSYSDLVNVTVTF